MGVTAIAKFVGVCTGMLLVDSVGRRPLLIYGSIGGAFCMVLMTIAQALGKNYVFFSGFSMAAFTLCFGISHALVYGVLISEVFSMHYKRVAFAVLGVLLYACGAVADALFLPLRTGIGS